MNQEPPSFVDDLREGLGQEPEEVSPKKPSRLGNFLKSALRWTTIFAVVLAVGVALTWVVRIRPLQDDIRLARGEVDAAQAQVTTLQAEVEALRSVETENADLKSQAVALQESMARAEQHLDLLRVLVDVTTAELAMAQDDLIAAKAALAGTGDRLESLRSSLDGTEAETVGSLGDRLALVLSELDVDEFAAQRDLEILANNILALERSLFSE